MKNKKFLSENRTNLPERLIKQFNSTELMELFLYTSDGFFWLPIIYLQHKIFLFKIFGGHESNFKL